MTPWNSDIGEWKDMEPESIMTKLENENKALKKELAAAKAELAGAADQVLVQEGYQDWLCQHMIARNAEPIGAFLEGLQENGLSYDMKKPVNKPYQVIYLYAASDEDSDSE